MLANFYCKRPPLDQCAAPFTRALLLQAQIWQLDFAVNPQVLREINREMRINEDVLRWVVKKLGTPRQAASRCQCKLRAFALV